MLCRATAILISALLIASGLALAATVDQPASPLAPNSDLVAPISAADRALVEDLEHRSFVYFWEQADHGTGLVLDRARVDGGRAQSTRREIASAAPTRVG